METGNRVAKPEPRAQKRHRRTERCLKEGEQTEQQIGRPGAAVTVETGRPGGIANRGLTPGYEGTLSAIPQATMSRINSEPGTRQEQEGAAMIPGDAMRGLSRREVVRALAAAALMGTLARQSERKTWAQEATPAASVTQESLISDTPGLLDTLGRAPIGQLTFAPGASLPEEFLFGPMIALVESGTFDVSVGDDAAPFPVAPGDRIDVSDLSAVTATNTGASEGAWLVLGLVDLSMSPSTWLFSPAWWLSRQSPAPGVEWRYLFADQDIVNRYAEVQFALDRVTLAPGAMLTESALQNATTTRAVWLFVEAGAIEGQPAWSEVGGATPVSDVDPPPAAVLRSGDAARFEIEQARQVRATDDEPAVLLVARVAGGRD
jgi:hypothetical protein